MSLLFIRNSSSFLIKSEEMAIKINKEEFKFIQDLSWEDVFDMWRKGEENLEHWIEFYKAKNFNSWEEWRIGTVKSLKLDTRNWGVYEIIDPAKSAPTFFGGPYKTWREKYYGNKNFVTFAELVEHPEIQHHPVINEMEGNFPERTDFIGLLTERGVVIIEGMHRCSAIALAAKEGKIIETDATIALAEFSVKELVKIINRSKDTKGLRH